MEVFARSPNPGKSVRVAGRSSRVNPRGVELDELRQ